MSDALKDIELWEVVRHAAHDVLQKTLQWREEHPSSEHSSSGTNPDAPSAHRYKDIAGIQELMNAVEARPVIRDKFAVPDYSSEDPYADGVIMAHDSHDTSYLS